MKIFYFYNGIKLELKTKKRDKIKYIKKSYINKISDKSDITKKNNNNNTKAHKKLFNYIQGVSRLHTV